MTYYYDIKQVTSKPLLPSEGGLEISGPPQPQGATDEEGAAPAAVAGGSCGSSQQRSPPPLDYKLYLVQVCAFEMGGVGRCGTRVCTWLAALCV
jgi:hypothetical protein